MNTMLPIPPPDTLLPDTLSGLLTLAMGDYRTTMEDPRYVIDMGNWHMNIEHFEKTICHVCLAGAVVAQTLQFPIDRTFSMNGAPLDVQTKMRALDALREGDVESAFFIMFEDDMMPADIRSALGDVFCDPVRWGDDPHQWEKDMDRLALDLATVGL